MLNKPKNTNPNPAKKFFQWDSDANKVKYYDKEKGETVLVDLPFKFINLDVLSTVKGYSSKEKQGFWSNEVRSSKSEPFVVKTKNGIKAEGLWSEIGEGLKGQGAKFANSVYIAYINGEKLELANIVFSGASIKEWFDFLKTTREDAIAITGGHEEKTGRITYSVPIFETITITPAQLEEAKKLNEELQAYLDEYFDYADKFKQEKSQSASASNNSNNTSSGLEDVDDPEDSDIPF